MEKDECIEAMSRDFYAEKSARESGKPWPPTVTTPIGAEPNIAPIVAEPNLAPIGARHGVKIEESKIETASQTSLPTDTESDEESECSGEYNDALTDVNMSLVPAAEASEWKTLKRLERETIETLEHIRHRLQAIENRATVPQQHASIVSTIGDVVLRVEFANINRLMIAEDGCNEMDLTSQEYQMRAGLRLRFAQSVLEFRGTVRDVVGFQVSTIGVPFRVAITAATVEIDERFSLSRDGLLMRASDANALPAITRHGLTLCGAEQQIVRIEYRGFRYEMDFSGQRLTMRPAGGPFMAPVTEEID